MERFLNVLILCLNHTMRKSLENAISGLKDDAKEDKTKKDDKSALDTPLGRLKSLEKEVSTMQSEVVI